MNDLFDDAEFWWKLWLNIRASSKSVQLRNHGWELRTPIDGKISKLRISSYFLYDKDRPGNYQEDFPGGFVGYQLTFNSFYIPSKMRFTTVYSQKTAQRFDTSKFYDKKLIVLNKTPMDELGHILMMVKLNLYG